MKAESGKLSDELEFARRSVNQYLEGVGKRRDQLCKTSYGRSNCCDKRIDRIRSGRSGKYKLQASESTKELEQIQEAFTKAQTREQTIRTLELAEADYIKVQEQGEKNSTGVGRTKEKAGK